MDVESEIRELKRRVGDLEGAVNVLAGQIGQVHPVLVALSKSAELRFDKVETLMVKVSDTNHYSITLGKGAAPVALALAEFARRYV